MTKAPFIGIAGKVMYASGFYSWIKFLGAQCSSVSLTKLFKRFIGSLCHRKKLVSLPCKPTK